VTYGELVSLFQLGVGVNLGFGAVVVFVEPARRQLERSLTVIESRLLELTRAVEAAPRGDALIEDVYAMNKSYLELLGGTRLMALEWLVWQSIPARLFFMLGAVVAFVGLTTSSAWAPATAPGFAYPVAVVVNLMPVSAAILLCLVSCWYQYKIFPRVEILQQKLFGRRCLISARATG
jgi:hypothetical protein